MGRESMGMDDMKYMGKRGRIANLRKGGKDMR